MSSGSDQFTVVVCVPLAEQLRHIDEEGMANRAARHWAMARRC